MAKKKKKAKDDDVKPKKRKSRPVDDEDDIEDEYSPEDESKPSLDIYVGLSSITLLVLICAAVLFYMDVDASKGKTPPRVALTVGSLDGARPAPPR